jgi:hypothetical protein
LHAVPQAPQLLTLVVRFVSQPLPVFMSQLPKPVAQLPPQVPAMQVRTTLGKVWQARPQALQLSGSVWRLTQDPLQSVVPPGQVLTQVPALHASLLPQRRPQAPQLFAVSRAVSQPLLLRPSQLPKPDAQAPRAQLPLLQVAAAFA